MKIIKTKFKELLIFESKNFIDNRGYFRELTIEKIIKKKLVFTVVSKSKKNVLRGLHFQFKKPQGKHISVIKGEIFDVAVDLRKNSPTYKKVFIEKLSEKNCKSIYIPAGFAHGFLTLGKENIVCYSCTEYRSVGNEYGIAYNDPALKIKWPRNKVIITKKDKFAKTLSELIEDKII